MPSCHPAPGPAALPSAVSPALSRLSAVTLDAIHQAILDLACPTASGPAVLRHRLQAEARDVLALAQISGRLSVRWIDLSAGLRAKIEMRVPVPYRPDPAGPVQIASRALLGVMYPPDSLTLPQAGYAFVRVLHPRAVWHGNVSPDVHQALCLGPSLPPGFPLREILLMTYGALSLQTTQFNQFDPAGLMHSASADWWQRNPQLIPLTREPFLHPEVPHVA